MFPFAELSSSRQASAASPFSPSQPPTSSVVTSSPASASSRAVIIPSPPLLPPPQSTVTRRARGNRSRANAATAADAARINSIDGIPNRSEVARSQACISAADKTCMATMLPDCTPAPQSPDP